LAQAGSVLARQSDPRDGLDHRDQHVARLALLRHQSARRPADGSSRALRGGHDRRRRRMAALPLRDPAAAAPDHPPRDAVLGHLPLRRLSARLRPHARRPAERHQSVRDLCVRHSDGRRPARARRLGGVGDAAGALIADRGVDHLHAEELMVTGHGRIESIVRVWLPVGFFLVLALFPFYWMAITSLKPNAELYNRTVMPLIVHTPTLKHYVDLLTKTSFLLWTWNTMLVALVATAISL